MAQGRSTKIISMIKWIRTSRLSINSLSLSQGGYRGGGFARGVEHRGRELQGVRGHFERLQRETSLLTTYWSESTLAS